METSHEQEKDLGKDLQEKEGTTPTHDTEEHSNQLEDLQTELKSFRSEREQLLEEIKNLKEELSKTKELNYTLGRQVNSAREASDTEALIHEMIYGKE